MDILENPVVVIVGVIFYSAYGLLAFAVTSDFTKALILTLISAVIGAVGMIVSAVITARSVNRTVQPQLDDVKRKVEADRRAADK